MIAEITKIDKRKSKLGGYFVYVFFKGKDGKSYKTCLYPQYRNFTRWKGLKTGDVLKNINIKKDNLIDADSLVEKI